MAVRQINTELALTGETAFNDQMKAVNNNLKTLKSDMAAVTAEFDGNADSVEALTAKQNILQDSVDQQKVKVDALRAMHKRAAETYGENSAEADKYKQQLNYATVALAKETSALQKNRDALEAAKNRMEDTASAADDVADAAEDLAESSDNAGDKLKFLSSVASGAKTAIKGVGTVSGGVAKGIGSIATAAGKATAAVMAAGAAMGTVALTSMVNFAKESAEAAKAASEAGETLTESQKAWLAYSGQLDSLDASVANAKSALGGILLPALNDLSSEAADVLNIFARHMEAAGDDTEKQAKVMSDCIVMAATLIRSKLPEYIETGKVLISGLGEGIAELGPDLLDTGLDLCMDLLNGIIEFAPELAAGAMELVGQLTQSLAEQGPDLLTSAIGMVTDIVRGLAQAAPDMIPAAVQLVAQLLTALVAAAPDLLLAGLELVYGILKGIFNAIPDLVNSVGTLIETFKSSFGEKAGEFLKIGSEIIDLILEGIVAAWDGVVSWFKGAWQNLVGNLNVDVNINGTATGAAADGSHAGGLDYVPFDGYLAELHRGEMVLTSAEAALYRRNQIQDEKTGATVNLYFTAKEMTEADINMVCDIVNRKLGEDL